MMHEVESIVHLAVHGDMIVLTNPAERHDVDMASWKEPHWFRIGTHVSFFGQMKSSSQGLDGEIIRRVMDIM